MIAAAFAIALLQQPAGAAEVQRLSWMAGCWTQTGGQSVVEEQWMAPGGGIMMGMSRTVMNGRTASYEFLRIAPMLSGTLAYIAAPSGQAPTTFPVKSMTASEVVFENLAHDFPQRIIYRKLADGSLRARIEGLNQGKVVGQDFDLKPCR